jgi:tungstate transport system ATP-binding protein
MLAAESVSYRYDDGEQVLRDVSLRATPGEVLGLIGPSGTGKTTLLRLLALFDPPDEGTVRVDGTDAWALSDDERVDRRRRIGMVFQNRSLFSTSVAHNAAYGLAVRRSWTERLTDWLAGLVGSPDLPAQVEEALGTVGLAELADRPGLQPGWRASVGIRLRGGHGLMYL